MKNKKYCEITSCCWGYRHELIGIILLILATILTLATCNSMGIFAMFLVGVVLFCHKCWFWHCHMDSHCHSSEDECGVENIEKEPKMVKKPKGKKIKG